MNTILTPYKSNQVKRLGNLVGGDVFVFYEKNMDLHQQISNGEVYLVTKDSHKEGTTKIVNVMNGLILQRDSDRQIIQLQACLELNVISTINEVSE